MSSGGSCSNPPKHLDQEVERIEEEDRVHFTIEVFAHLSLVQATISRRRRQGATAAARNDIKTPTWMANRKNLVFFAQNLAPSATTTRGVAMVEFPAPIEVQSCRVNRLTNEVIELKFSFELPFQKRIRFPTEPTFDGLCCRFCDADLIFNGTIENMYPLPSDSWFDIIDDCACNPNHSMTTRPSEYQIHNPPQRTCYAGIDFLSFSPKDFIKDSLLISSNPLFSSHTHTHDHQHHTSHDEHDDDTPLNHFHVQCLRCYSYLGHAVSVSYDQKSVSAIMLYKYTIASLYQSQRLNNGSFQEILTELLVSNFQENSCSKFLLCSYEDSSTLLPPIQGLVWLLNYDSEIAIGSVNYATPFNNNNDDINSSNLERVPFKRIIKVLYRDYTLKPNEGMEVEEENVLVNESIEGANGLGEILESATIKLYYPRNYIIEIFDILNKSTMLLPTANRKMYNLSVGFLYRQAF